MLGHLTRTAAHRPQGWSLVASSSRSIASTSVVRRPPITPFGEEEDEESGGGRRAEPKDPNFTTWLDTVGKQFAKSHRPRNWLGDQVPFPRNPSFKPPTPVSDELRSALYNLYMTNPETNSVRALAGRYHLSIKRVDAILRLKGLEEHWKKEGRQLQTGFRFGMEQLLGVTDDAKKFKSHEDWVESRMNVVESDTLDQVEGDDPARARYQRMFWEPVVDGQEPILPDALKKARDDAVRHVQEEETAKSADALLGHHREGGVATEVTAKSGSAAGRPSIKFLDVGGKFIDPKDRLRRMKESERRARHRSSKKPVTEVLTRS